MNGDHNTSQMLRTERVYLQRPTVRDEDLN